jgi:hypothetical protein
VKKLAFLLVLVVAFVGSLLLGLNDAAISIADARATKNETDSSVSEPHESAGATIKVTKAIRHNDTGMWEESSRCIQESCCQKP